MSTAALGTTKWNRDDISFLIFLLFSEEDNIHKWSLKNQKEDK